MTEQRQNALPVLTDQPLEFEFDPDTGIIWMTVVAGYEVSGQPGQPQQMRILVGLTLETSRSLLAALPKLQSLLEQATKGPTKPRSVQ